MKLFAEVVVDVVQKMGLVASQHLFRRLGSYALGTGLGEEVGEAVSWFIVPIGCVSYVRKSLFLLMFITLLPFVVVSVRVEGRACCGNQIPMLCFITPF